ncbi:helix-hairpin-helix domain-containing protein [Modestobacter altitudinis]|uniref:helix-hairpin-helix domain-containing protein n=1 Tax=Modestobacter altitudinis TaxID=2213158 RepID=UPI00110D061C|nr:helix-hairpin-helix domain-containing protein [Modestobacter altitudinis]
MSYPSRPPQQKPSAPIQAVNALVAAEKKDPGLWYFLVTVFTAGFLAAVPFWHAYVRLRRPELRTMAISYTAVDLFLVLLLGITPPSGSPEAAESSLSAIGGFMFVAVTIAACVQLRGIRREVYETPPAVPVHADPAVARALAGRQRRDEARKMWGSDPALARELGVGRPDLRRGFDDGGLVDLNSAPAAVIAQVCGIEVQQAEAIVAARQTRGGTYFNLGELFVDVSLPPHVQQQLADRAIV